MKNNLQYKTLVFLFALTVTASLTWACGSDDDDSTTPDASITGGTDTTVTGGTDTTEPATGGTDTTEPATGGTDTTEPATGGTDTTEPTPELLPPVTTDKGPISGAKMGDSGVVRYLGIPYGKPPVGDLRWKAAQEADPWTETIDGTKWPNRCPQSEQGVTATQYGEISEDCLYLNLMTPAESEDEKLPVMVFFHGGGLSILSGNSPVYCHSALASHGAVVLTVNARLGPIGYMAHPALSAESGKGSGNYGTTDLIAALKWVQRNVAKFGGDPDNVTIFGESGGGTKVISVVSSPLSEGLFQKAIVESGARSTTPDGVDSLADAEAIGKSIVTELGLDSTSADVLTEMRNKSWEDVIAAGAVEELAYEPNLTVDGDVLPDTVYNIFQAGTQNNVPLIIGANEGEVEALRDRVPVVADAWANVSSNVYVYNFTYVPPPWKDECPAFHGLELTYVFGNVEEGLASVTTVFLANRGGCTSSAATPDENDDVVAENTMKLWVSFAQNGDPSIEGTQWPPYETVSKKYLDIGVELAVKTDVAQSFVEPPAATE